MSFLGNPPPPAAAEEPVIDNDGWFPAIDLRKLRARARLDGTVTPERLRHSALEAIASVNTELAGYRQAQIALGHASLADVPAPQLDGQSVQLTRYHRAVYSAVQADLAERMRDFDTTGAGDKRADRLEPAIEDMRRNLRWAISDLLGIRRTTVELI